MIQLCKHTGITWQTMPSYENLWESRHRESIVHLDKVQLETKGGVKYTSLIQRFFYCGVYEHGRERENF